MSRAPFVPETDARQVDRDRPQEQSADARRSAAHKDPLTRMVGLGLRAYLPLELRLRIRPGRFASFGEGSVLRAPARINGAHGISIGDQTQIGSHSMLWLFDEYGGESYAPRLTIGDRCQFGERLYVNCCERITIGNDVLASDNVFIADTYHGYSDPSMPPIRQPMGECDPVSIEDGVFLGIGCAVLHGVTIGERSYVGANAVVTKDVAPWTMVAGNPARPIKRWNGEAWIPAPRRMSDAL